jgi:hypothetical protein
MAVHALHYLFSALALDLIHQAILFDGMGLHRIQFATELVRVNKFRIDEQQHQQSPIAHELDLEKAAGDC